MCAAPGAAAETAAETLTVARVIDGDSLKLSDGEEVRLIGIDAPEFKDQKRNAREARRLRVDAAAYAAHAPAARAQALRLTSSSGGPRTVRLELDGANAAAGHRDKYGRLLAYVWVGAGGGEAMLNEELLRGGYATVFRAFPFKLRDRFLAAETEAKKARRGLWSGAK